MAGGRVAYLQQTDVGTMELRIISLCEYHRVNRHNGMLTSWCIILDRGPLKNKLKNEMVIFTPEALQGIRKILDEVKKYESIMN